MFMERVGDYVVQEPHILMVAKELCVVWARVQYTHGCAQGEGATTYRLQRETQQHVDGEASGKIHGYWSSL